MYEELNELLMAQGKNQMEPEVTGRIVDILKRLDYFRSLDNQFGTDYLITLLPVLQTFILRQGFGIINQCDHYVLVDGDLREEQPLLYASHPVQAGKLVDPRQKQNVCFKAKSDCKLIRIKRGPKMHHLLFKKLMLLQREKNKQIAEIHKTLSQKDQNDKKELIRKVSYFQALGDFDFLEIVYNSQIRQYSQGSLTHSVGQNVKQIGCILSGKLKFTYATQKVSKLARHHQEKGMHIFISEGDWIGLEQHLQQSSFKSSGEVFSIEALIVWTPYQLFKAKFNIKNNYQAARRLFGLIQTKKALIERSFSCRKKQEQHQREERQYQKPNPKLIEKIAAINVTNGQKKRTSFRNAKNPKDFLIPQKIMHKMNFNSDQNLNILPKLQQKINLFPKQYEETPVSSHLQKQLYRLQSIMKIDKKQEHNYFCNSTKILNPQMLYQTILAKVDKKNTRKYSTNSVEKCNEMFQTKPFYFGLHFNQSIYNNFRVALSNRKTHGSLPKMRTLDIITATELPNQ